MAKLRSELSKSIDEMELDIWRLRSSLGLPPSAKEREFVEFCKTMPEFQAVVKKYLEERGLERYSSNAYSSECLTRRHRFERE